MQKIYMRLLTWVILPGLFLTAIQLDDPKLAIVGAVLAWVIPMIFGPLTLIVMCIAVTSKPGGSDYAKHKADFTKKRPGPFVRAFSWVALGSTGCHGGRDRLQRPAYHGGVLLARRTMVQVG